VPDVERWELGLEACIVNVIEIPLSIRN